MPGPARILIVDDSVELRTMLRAAFERDGWDVVEAEDGRRAIEAAREGAPDAILLDLAMPVMDGLEALPTLRELCPDTRIVMLSGAGAAQTTRRALAAGADGYLHKGGSVRSVVTYVHQLAERAAEPPASGPTGDSRPGVVEVVDEALFRVISTDVTADTVLGRALPPGLPLFSSQPRLASLLHQHRTGGSFTADLGSGPITVEVEARGSSLHLHLRRDTG